MGLFTTRAGLYKPGGGSTGLNLPDEPVDIDKLNANFDKIDALLGARNIPSVSSYAGTMDGDLIYAQDTKLLHMYSGSEGKLIFPSAVGPAAASDAERGSIFPAPAQGDQVLRTDLGWTEQYYGDYDAVTNKGGAVPAGWYPVGGRLPRITLKKSSGCSTTTVLGIPTGGGAVTVPVTDGFEAPVDWTVTAPVAGLYRVVYEVMTGSAGSAGVVGEIRRNSTTGTRYGFGLASQVGLNDRNSLSMSADVPLNAGEKTALWLRSSVGVVLGEEVYLRVEYIGPKIIA